MVWKIGQGDPYALLFSLLAEEKGIEPMPPVARQEGGKPWFPDCPHLHFSLSHSGDLALAALGDAPLGADLEIVRNRTVGLPRYALSDREYAWFRDRGSCWEDFYTLWTMKEARVKCTGEGIFRAPARQIAVPLLEPGREETWEGFRFAALSGENWRGAVCLKIL